MNIKIIPKRKEEYITTEQVEKYFLDEFISGSMDPRFISMMYEDRGQFLMDALLAFRRLTDDYSDKVKLEKALGTAVCKATQRHLRRINA